MNCLKSIYHALKREKPVMRLCRFAAGERAGDNSLKLHANDRNKMGTTTGYCPYLACKWERFLMFSWTFESGMRSGKYESE